MLRLNNKWLIVSDSCSMSHTIYYVMITEPLRNGLSITQSLRNVFKGPKSARIVSNGRNISANYLNYEVMMT